MYTYETATFELEDEDEFLMGRLYQALQDQEVEEEVLVCDEASADRLAAESIIESVWAFNPDFLAGATGMPEAVFQALADTGRCEANNDAVLALIGQTCGLDAFVDEAIGADGRGHFLSLYDGQENELELDGETYYVYRL